MNSRSGSAGYIESQIIALNVSRIVGAIEHRLGEPLGAKIEAARLG